MKKSDNKDRDRQETPRSDPSEISTEPNGSYYYDDSTGYEIFEDDESDEENSACQKKKDERND